MHLPAARLASESASAFAPWAVFLAGTAAALQVGKLAPALPFLQHDLGTTLMMGGLLLSLSQLAAASFGIFAGLVADRFGLRRCLLGGLITLAGASSLGSLVHDPQALLILRGTEGLGILACVVPAPGLIRRVTPPHRLATLLGVWGAYMPLGMTLAMFAGPLVMGSLGWPGWWQSLAAVNLLCAAMVARAVPPDSLVRPATTATVGTTASAATVQGPAVRSIGARLRDTLGTRGPWLVSLTFATYSGQWLTLVGFLPTLYRDEGLPPTLVAVLSAAAAGVNMAGNVMSGRLMQAGVPARRLMTVGFVCMACGALLVFDAPRLLSGGAFPSLGLAPRVAGALMFSGLGGLIPGSLFSQAVKVAPSEDTVSTTVGWMQQCSSLGQLTMPPLAALLAGAAGTWHWTPALTVTLAATGLVLVHLPLTTKP